MDLNEVTARPLILHALADCWVRAFTSLDPQARLLDSCRESAAMRAGGGDEMGES